MARTDNSAFRGPNDPRGKKQERFRVRGSELLHVSLLNRGNRSRREQSYALASKQKINVIWFLPRAMPKVVDSRNLNRLDLLNFGSNYDGLYSRAAANGAPLIGVSPPSGYESATAGK